MFNTPQPCPLLTPSTSDYNYIREGDSCVPVGPEPIPAGVCVGDTPNQTYQGSSGYRLIPGNTCKREGGVSKDDPVTKSCAEGMGHSHTSIVKANFLQLNPKKAKWSTKLYVCSNSPLG